MYNTKTPRKQTYSTGAISWLAGSLSGMASVIIGQPFDIVKVRMQNQSQITPLYRSAVHWAKVISQNEGKLAFYKGTAAPLIGIGACTSVQFSMNEFGKSLIKRFNKSNDTMSDGKLTPFQLILSGGFAGFGNSFVSTPVEQLRILMQNQSNIRDPRMKFKGCAHALIKLSKMYGFGYLYRGLKITMARDVICLATFFGAYETLKSKTQDLYGTPSLSTIMTIGTIAGILSWLTSYPLDIIKTRIQLDCYSNPLYKNAMFTAKKIYRDNGIHGFVKGIEPCIARAIFIFPAIVGVYELTMSHFTNQEF